MEDEKDKETFTATTSNTSGVWKLNTTTTSPNWDPANSIWIDNSSTVSHGWYTIPETATKEEVRALSEEIQEIKELLGIITKNDFLKDSKKCKNIEMLKEAYDQYLMIKKLVCEDDGND